MTPEQAKAYADQIRQSQPEVAKMIDNAVLQAGRQGDSVPINISIAMRLEKFDGDYTPGQQPVEVIETVDIL